MPIEKIKPDQTVIHCTGDIKVLGFNPKQKYCNGVAWCLFQEGSPGEIGREVPSEEYDAAMYLKNQPGVLIATNNYRSLDIIIETLTELRDDLKSIEESGGDHAESRIHGSEEETN